MADALIELASVIGLLLLLLVYLWAARLPPKDAQENTRVREILLAASEDEGFRDTCTRLCRITPAEAKDVEQFLTNPHVHITARFPFFGGWAGRDVVRNRYCIALPNWAADNLLWAVAIHELFHLVRHIQGTTSFDTEFEQAYGVGPAKRIIEEFIVWRKTVNVDFFGSVAALLATFLPFVMLAVIILMLQT